MGAKCDLRLSAMRLATSTRQETVIAALLQGLSVEVVRCEDGAFRTRPGGLRDEYFDTVKEKLRRLGFTIQGSWPDEHSGTYRLSFPEGVTNAARDN